jgi:opine dehydrogenase
LKICIIGAGNAGCAHAFKLTEYGHEIRLVKTSHSMHDDFFSKTTEDGTITAVDHTHLGLTSTQKIALITRDAEQGINGAEVVMVMTQSLQHDSLAPWIGPLIKKDQLLILIPGNLGSILFSHYVDKEVLIAEGESTPFDARIEADMKIHILFKNVRNAVSFIPANRTAEGNAIVSRILDTYGYTRRNVIESGLHNPNLVVHTIGSIMSAARIEQMKGEFWMYRESFSPSVWNIVSRLDDEKNAVLEKFGCERLNYLDACKFRNEEDLTKDSIKVFQSYAQDGGPKGPSSLNTRFLYEDVPNGLCVLSALGKKIGTGTPTCDALINLANCLLNTDFWQYARTTERLGISSWTFDQIVRYLNYRDVSTNRS